MSVPPATPAVFSALENQQPDALLALIGLERADPRPGKIDVGVGVYRDEQGRTPVFAAVKAAEAALLAEQETKAYLGPEGDARFVDLLGALVFGAGMPTGERITGVQTPGGTGALRLGAELVARSALRASASPTVWLPRPTWPNHGPIFLEAGLRLAEYSYFDAETRDLDFSGMMTCLSHAAAGDLVLLHGCCHNPTGASLTGEQWRELAALLVARDLIPFVDSAYQGLGDGWTADGDGTATVLAAAREGLLAYSCDKNFGLYRERVGALWVVASGPDRLPAVRDNMLVLARSLWSMPPDHGAAVVRTILERDDLRRSWRDELESMRMRINELRATLAKAAPAMHPIGRQRGMFALLPLVPAAARVLRATHGIYMADSGRINVAGLRLETVKPFVDAIGGYLG